MMTRRFVAVASALAALQLSATTYTWTGMSENNSNGVGKWTDPANWSVGGAAATDFPGRYYDTDGTTVLGDDKAGDVAVFSSVGEGAATTVDLAGHATVGCVQVTGADAPSFTFGTAQDQTLRIESKVSGESDACNVNLLSVKFVVDKSVTRPQTILARLGCGYGQQYAADTEWSYCGLVNCSSVPLEVHDFGYANAINSSSDGPKQPYTTLTVSGTGKINFNGAFSSKATCYPNFRENVDVTFKKSFTASRIFAAGGKGPASMRNLELAEGVCIYHSVSGWSGIHCNQSVHWYGPGCLRLNGQANFEESADATDVHVVDCHVYATEAASSTYGFSWTINCTGPYNFNYPSNGIPKGLIILYNGNNSDAAGKSSALLLSAPKFGRKTDDGNRPLGQTDGVLCYDDAGIRFTGSVADTTDLDLMLGEATVKSATYTWKHPRSQIVVSEDGTAPFTVESELLFGYVPNASSTAKAYCGTNTLHLTGDGAGGGIWNRALADTVTVNVPKRSLTGTADLPVTVSVRKTGAGRWTLAQTQTYTGNTVVEGGELYLTGTIDSSDVVFRGGTLVIPAGTTKTLKSATAAAGASKIVVEAGATLTVLKYDDTGAGTVDLWPDKTATVIFSEKVGTETPVLMQTLRKGGAKVFFDVNGKPISTVADIEINASVPVKGGVVPNDATKNVAILNGGTSGNITVADEATEVASLSQIADEQPATVDLTGKTLRLSSLNLAYGAASMTVGVERVVGAADNGMLKPLASDTSNKKIDVTVDDPASELTVNAYLDASTARLYKFGRGTARFRNADKFSNIAYCYGGLLLFDGVFPDTSMTLNAESGGSIRFVGSGIAKQSVGLLNSYVCTRNPEDGSESELVIENAKAKLDRDHANRQLWIGTSAEATPPTVSKMRITNANFSGGWTNETNLAQIYVGHSFGDGTLTVEGDSVLGYSANLGYKSHGALYLDGGLQTFTNSEWSGHLWIGSLDRGYGYYALADGKLDAQGNISMAAGQGSAGVLHQTGGEFYTKDLRCGVSNGGELIRAIGIVRHSGGTATYATIHLPKGDSGANNLDNVLLVDGGDVTVGSNSGLQLLNGRFNDEVTVVLSRGGKLTSRQISLNTQAGYGVNGTNNTASLSFDGGTYAATASGDFVTVANSLARATVFAGGAGFDVPENVTLFVNQELKAPEKKGVASVAWNGFPDTPAFVGPPAVKIIGDGVGAVATAVFDRENRAVTGIEVACPGSGYTWAKAVVYYGSYTTKRAFIITNDCSLTETTPAAGLIVKKGAGTLKLTHTNTVAGVSLEAGTLELSAPDVLPEGFVAEFKGGRIATASGVTLSAFTLALAVGETQTYPDAFAFPEGSTLTVSGTVDENVTSYKLATFPNGYTGRPACATTLPKDWRIVYGSNAIRLSKIRGAMLLVR